MLLFQPRVSPTHTLPLLFNITNYETWCNAVSAHMQSYDSAGALPQPVDININKPLYLFWKQLQNKENWDLTKLSKMLRPHRNQQELCRNSSSHRSGDFYTTAVV